MNKLIFSEGGQPLHLDDLAFMQESYTSILTNLLRSWRTCILGGVEFTVHNAQGERIQGNPEAYPVTVSVSEGYVAYQGQIYQFKASQVQCLGADYKPYVLFSRHEEGAKTFEDGSEHPTIERYQARIEYLKEAPTASVYIAWSNLPHLGVDFARPPRLHYSYEGDGEVLDFAELSRYSGVLTLGFGEGERMAKSGHFATLSLSGAGNLSGQWVEDLADGYKTIITLQAGKFTIKRETPPNSGSSSHIGFVGKKTVTMLVSWNYEQTPSHTEQDSGSNQGGGQGRYSGSTSSGYGRGYRNRR